MLTKKFALKVKIKSLAAETKIIKKAIRQTKDVAIKSELRGHHVHVVRREARHSQLAYAFLRGREYCQVESKCTDHPDFKKVEDLVIRFGQSWHYLTSGSWTSWDIRRAEQAHLFAAWKSRAILHLASSRQTQ